jgi:hypothetical protein
MNPERHAARRSLPTSSSTKSFARFCFSDGARLQHGQSAAAELLNILPSSIFLPSLHLRVAATAKQGRGDTALCSPKLSLTFEV